MGRGSLRNDEFVVGWGGNSELGGSSSLAIGWFEDPIDHWPLIIQGWVTLPLSKPSSTANRLNTDSPGFSWVTPKANLVEIFQNSHSSLILLDQLLEFIHLNPHELPIRCSAEHRVQISFSDDFIHIFVDSIRKMNKQIKCDLFQSLFVIYVRSSKWMVKQTNNDEATDDQNAKPRPRASVTETKKKPQQRRKAHNLNVIWLSLNAIYYNK